MDFRGIVWVQRTQTLRFMSKCYEMIWIYKHLYACVMNFMFKPLLKFIIYWYIKHNSYITNGSHECFDAFDHLMYMIHCIIFSHMYHFFLLQILSVGVFACMHVCVPLVCLVSLEVRREWQLPLKLMTPVLATMLGIELKSPVRAASMSNHWPISPPSQNILCDKFIHDLKCLAHYCLYSLYCAIVYQCFLFVRNCKLAVNILVLMWGCL